MPDAPLHQVLRALGHAGLGLVDRATEHESPLGDVALHEHQREAVQRLRPLLAEHGGALLADDVGLGKTYVALAVANAYDDVEVIAPAGLVRMWRDAGARVAGAQAPPVRSLHAFSRAVSPSRCRPSTLLASRLVIIDEAHHLRTPSTRRYANVAEWCRGAHVLLLSATPVHNTTADLSHLFALFLGTRALSLPVSELSQLTVRRTANEMAHVIAAPTLRTHRPLSVPDAPAVTHALAQLPAPVPTREGQAAGALVALGLIRAWCSSAAACLALVRRRRQRASVLEDAFALGQWPSREEMRSWTMGDDAVQLGFTSLLVNDVPIEPAGGGAPRDAPDLEAARAQLAVHRDALSALDRAVRRVATATDRARVDALRHVRSSHRGLTVIAFSQFAETVHALGRLMRWDAGVATLTSRGGRVAGGAIARDELIGRVAPVAHARPTPPAHERILLLLTTDLLAEGVNLQDAAVVVHLDLPWTPTALAQREGRITRLGSRHEEVHAYTLQPPGGGAALLRMAARLRRKARAAMVVLTPDAAAVPALRLLTSNASSSATQRRLRGWTRLTPDSLTAAPAITASSCDVARSHAHDPTLPAQRVAVLIGARRMGWLAAVERGASRQLCGGWFARPSWRTHASREPRVLRLLTEQVELIEQSSDVTPSIAGSTPTISTTRAETSPTRSASETHAHTRAHARARRPAEVCRAERSARRAVHRWLARAHTHGLVDTCHAPSHRASRLLRAMLACASLSDRLVLAPRVAAAGKVLRSLRGAGDERALLALLDGASALEPGLPADRLFPWIDAITALGRAGDVHGQRASFTGDARITALLLLLD